MEKFYTWCDDKVQVIAAVLIITIMAMIVMPGTVSLDIVYGGLFGLAAGMGMNNKG